MVPSASAVSALDAECLKLPICREKVETVGSRGAKPRAENGMAEPITLRRAIGAATVCAYVKVGGARSPRVALPDLVQASVPALTRRTLACGRKRAYRQGRADAEGTKVHVD